MKIRVCCHSSTENTTKGAEAMALAMAPETFGCTGRFFIFSLGHPGVRDLEAAAAFAKGVASARSS